MAAVRPGDAGAGWGVVWVAEEGDLDVIERGAGLGLRWEDAKEAGEAEDGNGWGFHDGW